MDNDHLRLIGNRVGDFLLVFIELFSLGVMAEALQVNIGLKSAILLRWGPIDPKFPTNHSSPQKTRLNDLLYGIKIWTYLSSILSKNHAFDRWTDRQNSHH